jgi:glucose-1-phosphate adenylyltransferase
MGIINLQDENSKLTELTDHRAAESIPFAGRFRMIDFALSSIVNSGIISVGVLLPDESRSILDHLRSGKDWDLARRRDGLYYLPSAKIAKEDRQGDLKNFYFNLDFIENTTQKYVLVTNGSFVYNMDFNDMLQFHQEKGADITMAYYTAKGETKGNNTVLDTDENGLVTDVAEKPVVYEGSKVSMAVYLMEKNIFANLVRNAYERGGKDFLVDCIVRRASEYKMYACEHSGYVAHIDSMAAYYKSNMDMLDPAIWEELYMGQHAVYTKVKDEVPVQYKADAKVKNSLIANGCIIDGEVENSILFRGVKVKKGVRIKDSIIMQKCELKEGSPRKRHLRQERGYFSGQVAQGRV